MNAKFRRRAALLGIALSCGGALTSATSADTLDNPEPKTQVVDYSDLNLANVAEAKELYRRIRKAADRVCDRVSPVDVLAYQTYLTCRGRAVSEAVEKINEPALNALHRGKTPKARSG